MAKLNVFLSWSGERRKAVASALNDWLPPVINAVRPFFSSDTEKGVDWFEKITENLQNSTGIFCLTPENLDSPWLHFEAAALHKGLTTSRLWTLLLFDLKPTDVKRSLGAIQHTLPTKEDMKKMLTSINTMCGDDAIPVGVLESALEAHWDRLSKA